MRRTWSRRIVATFLTLGTLAVVAGSALAASYDTVNLNDDGYCVGYGWEDSQSPYGVYAGTSQAGGSGPCYRRALRSLRTEGGGCRPPP